MKHKQLLKAVLVLALVLAHLPVQPTYAGAVTVNSTTDVSDGDTSSITNLIANPGLDGVISLREAIEAANNTVGSDIIEFNIDPVTDPGCSGGVCTIQPTSWLPPLTDDGTIIGGYSQPGAAPATDKMAAVLKIELDGSKAGGSVSGLSISSANNVIAGLVINRFGEYGIRISGSGATGNAIVGNHIGTDASGTSDLGNTSNGVWISNGAQNNTIGGNTAGERNVISGNEGVGVNIRYSDTMSNTVSGNYIGTDASGTLDRGNTGAGVYIGNGAQSNTIAQNVISGNNLHGVEIGGSTTMSNTVLGNYIGTDESGTFDLGNTHSGVLIYSGAHNNTIGGNAAGERNIISGNSGNGIWITDSDGNTVLGNYIGIDVSGTLDLGNDEHGVSICGDAQSNTVGPGNVIAYNGEDGVDVQEGSPIGNIFTQNSIFSNTMGIDLWPGANGGIEAPTIMTTTVGSVNIGGQDACAGCKVEVFENSDTDGEGETYLGSATADASGHFTVTVTYLTKPYLTATARDETKGTSEFSDVFEATVELSPPLGPVYLPIIMRNN